VRGLQALKWSGRRNRRRTNESAKVDSLDVDGGRDSRNTEIHRCIVGGEQCGDENNVRYKFRDKKPVEPKEDS